MSERERERLGRATAAAGATPHRNGDDVVFGPLVETDRSAEPQWVADCVVPLR
ncbi:hypothetical protein GCM10023094_26020 [Rhodococcus olei]|uniref:Uncharacterized protein n=1 Tax=Rhodococcus olei TaxID=2161675 RepID=A0ABP8P4M6_9NOCA